MSPIVLAGNEVPLPSSPICSASLHGIRFFEGDLAVRRKTSRTVQRCQKLFRRCFGRTAEAIPAMAPLVTALGSGPWAFEPSRTARSTFKPQRSQGFVYALLRLLMFCLGRIDSVVILPQWFTSVLSSVDVQRGIGLWLGLDRRNLYGVCQVSQSPVRIGAAERM